MIFSIHLLVFDSRQMIEWVNGLNIFQMNEPIRNFSQSESVKYKMSSKDVENVNLRISQKEKDIDEITEAIKKLNKDISALYDRINETKDEKERRKLQRQADGLQKQADGLRDDRKSLETQLSNLKQCNFPRQKFILDHLRQENLGGLEERKGRRLEQKDSPDPKVVKHHVSDYFNEIDPPNSFKLLHTSGAEWLYVGRTELVLSFAEILLTRFKHFGSEMQLEKKYNKMPFSSTIRGAGKSKANQDMLAALKREVKTDSKNEHLGFTFQDLLHTRFQ
jgi:cell division protein FtsB